MSRASVGRWANITFVGSIQEELLFSLFQAFQPEIDQHRALTMLLSDYLEGEEYKKAVAWLLSQAKRVPDGLRATLAAIDDLASHAGHERLEKVFTQAGRRPQFKFRSSCADIAIQTWLQERDLFAEAHSHLQLRRLTSWQYFYASAPCAELTQLDASAIGRIEADLDAWFTDHNRGHKTSRVQTTTMDGELCFLIRHGDTYARKAAVQEQQVEIVEFRPAKDDVVAFSALRGELRINARTKGERELYRQVFGQRLFGRADYFHAQDAYTLRPLAEAGRDSLEVSDVAGIRSIYLNEVEIDHGVHLEDVVTRKARDLFWMQPELPKDGKITRAVFTVHFDGFKIGKVEVRPPDVLKLTRQCDASPIHEWMEKRGFRRIAERNEIATTAHA